MGKVRLLQNLQPVNGCSVVRIVVFHQQSGAAPVADKVATGSIAAQQPPANRK
jgi:hypothetical protein